MTQAGRGSAIAQPRVTPMASSHLLIEADGWIVSVEIVVVRAGINSTAGGRKQAAVENAERGVSGTTAAF